MNSKVEIKRAAYYLLAFFLVFCPGGIAREISFNRDIRPILSDRCFACHGPDASDRKAKLRLDRADGPEGAFRINDGVRSRRWNQLR